MIPYEARRWVYQSAIATNGIECQILVAIEEMSELTKELAKAFRPGGTSPEKLVDEIADVTVMMEQLRIIFEVNDAVKKRMDFKVRRLAQNIGITSEMLEEFNV